MIQSTTDIWFTAYLMYLGIKILKYDNLGKGKVRCYFQLTQDQWNTYKLEFNNSEFIKFKGLTEQVKDLSH